MSWREILNADSPDFSDKRYKSPPKDPFCHFSPFSHKERELKNDLEKLEADSPVLDHLTETERQAYEDWFSEMTGEKFNMSVEEARSEAMKLLVKTSRLLKIGQATQDYKLDGYLKIFSTKLNRSIYLAKDEQAKKRVPDKSLQVFLESEVKALRGLNPDESALMLEAKAIFNFNGAIEDGGQNEK